ncbi:MAG: response regulator [Phenylobacterium sp.]|jgi:two-component system response regulator FixJ|uniref:response regulator transcription factor n=1 Tax=Phenylobacterium sp. TaxID=1871053 RepID=UPI001A1F7A43|nr:response regulator [Phenylobacterium sp.]MBJ7409891.1 response regulator [Phenylobacterium sp.]
MAPPAVHVIDDDEAVRDSLAIMLETRGFDVTTYATAQAFLSQAERGVGGCVITDIQMPEMNGLQLLRAFNARNMHIPVLVVTARASRTLAQEALAQGARAVIEKPFAPEILVEAVQAALDAAA